MILINQSDFKSLKDSAQYGGLYDHLSAVSRDGTGTIAFNFTDGTMLIKTENLGVAFQTLLAEWIRNNNIEVIKVSESAKAAPVEPDDALSKLQRQQRAEAEAHAQAVTKAADDRFVNYWVNEQGLLRSQKNGQLLENWLETNRATYDVYHVDLAINSLTNELTWAIWSPRKAAPKLVKEEAVAEPEYLDTFTRAELIAKLRNLDRERRERFIEKCGGLARVNARLAAREPQEVRQ